MSTSPTVSQLPALELQNLEQIDAVVVHAYRLFSALTAQAETDRSADAQARPAGARARHAAAASRLRAALSGAIVCTEDDGRTAHGAASSAVTTPRATTRRNHAASSWPAACNSMSPRRR